MKQSILFFLFLSLFFSPFQPIAAAQSTAPAAGAALRVERTPIADGGELLTVFGTLQRNAGEEEAVEIPLIAVLRDTLGDDRADNDRLRYLWAFGYTRPSFKQHVAASVPFYYGRAGNAEAGTEVPPPLLDLADIQRQGWYRMITRPARNFLLDSQDFVVRASVRSYLRNRDDYRKAHTLRALAILSLVGEATAGEAALSESERREVQARLMLADREMTAFVDDVYLNEVYRRETAGAEDRRAHNWEMLRQRAEAEGLTFEPLDLEDGKTTHAILWTSREDVRRNAGKKFNGRFLNMANPWRDRRLRKWRGYTETRTFDAEGRRVEEGTPGASTVELIPLAIYGLDHPRVPILLIDFRSRMNAKMREASHRLLADVTRNLMSISLLGNPSYFAARAAFTFVNARRGNDFNQPSRMRAYSQLKTLLAVGGRLSPRLREEIARRIDRVSINPMESDTETEAKVAWAQHSALMALAGHPDGLAAQLRRDREREATRIEHGKTERALFEVGRVLSFGLYRHKEKLTPSRIAELDGRRRLDHHERFLREVVRSTPKIEVVWDIEEIRRSLEVIAAHGDMAGKRVAKTVAEVFARTEDERARSLCLASLYRIDNEAAKHALLRIHRDERYDERWRELSATYLRSSLREQRRIWAADEKEIMRLGL